MPRHPPANDVSPGGKAASPRDPERTELLDAVRRALRSEPRIGAEAGSIRLELSNGVFVLEGEVANVAVKKLALESAARIPGAGGIADRLRVKPASVMGDREIALHLRDAFLQEPAFAGCAIFVLRGAGSEIVREPLERTGAFEIAVADGVVTLNGKVAGLTRKRLAGVLAWWVPGSRDVVNGIAVDPDEPDTDHGIVEAVRIVLEKDPFVAAEQIRIGARNAVVRLTGIVPTESERDMAEFDAWYVFGVDRVLNDIEVRA